MSTYTPTQDELIEALSQRIKSLEVEQKIILAKLNQLDNEHAFIIPILKSLSQQLRERDNTK